MLTWQYEEVRAGAGAVARRAMAAGLENGGGMSADKLFAEVKLSQTR